MKISNDQYYTPIHIANHCIDKVYEVIGEENISEVIEPSVGDGAFLHHSDMIVHFAYDIEPRLIHSASYNDFTVVTEGDFLSQDISYMEGRLLIGNPPYGERMNMAQKFFKKAVQIGDYVAFILPISQLNNTSSLYEFDLVYSEDLGVQTYSDRKLHCCFNIYRRPKSGDLNKRTSVKLKDVSIYRQDSKGYADRDFDVRMCYWGTVGKILSDGESYSGEFKIKIHNDSLRDKAIEVLTNFDWKGYVQCISMKKLQQFHILQVLKDNVQGIN